MTARNVCIILAALALSIRPAGAASADAEKTLQSAVNEVLTIAESASSSSSLPGKLRPVLVKYISFDAMTRRAVGLGWRQFTEEQKQKAIDLFTILIIRTYSEKFTPGEHPVIKFKASKDLSPGQVEVPTTVAYQGSNYDVSYRMEDTGGWKITDVVIEGVSLIGNYRPQFDAQFKKDGAKAVIAALTQAEGKN